MWLESVDRDHLERSVSAARLRALAITPYTKAWELAMIELEDLERLLWRLDEAGLTPDQGAGGDRRQVAVPT